MHMLIFVRKCKNYIHLMLKETIGPNPSLGEQFFMLCLVNNFLHKIFELKELNHFDEQYNVHGSYLNMLQFCSCWLNWACVLFLFPIMHLIDVNLLRYILYFKTRASYAYALFAWLISHGWKYCWLICCERKILFVSWKVLLISQTNEAMDL